MPRSAANKPKRFIVFKGMLLFWSMTTELTKKDTPWLQGDGVTHHISAGLYLVATPIGNLRDITLRALATLRAADIVVCEDTRVSKKLLAAYGISKKLEIYNDHSDARQRTKIITAALGGKSVALISDAGMPLISDPGYKLVTACAEAGVKVTSVPGANAPLAALQLSGLPSDQFSFLGFLPAKTKARCDMLRLWEAVPATLVAFESAKRLIKSLADIASVMPGRSVAVVREITKLHEEVRKGSAAELAAHYEEHGPPRGEIVLVIAPPQDREISQSDVEEKLRAALKILSTKEAAAQVAEQTGLPRKVLYDLALRLNKNDGTL